MNSLSGHSWLLDQAAILLTKYAPELFGLWFMALWFWPAPRRRERRRLVVAAVLSGLLALAINTAVAARYDRLRPFAAMPDQVHQLVAHDPHASFPSDHASGSFAFAAAMTTAGPVLGPAFWVAGALVALSRLYVGVHWPTDLLASLVVGVASAATVRFLLRRFMPGGNVTHKRVRAG